MTRQRPAPLHEREGSFLALEKGIAGGASVGGGGDAEYGEGLERSTLRSKSLDWFGLIVHRCDGRGTFADAATWVQNSKSQFQSGMGWPGEAGFDVQQ